MNLFSANIIAFRCRGGPSGVGTGMGRCGHACVCMWVRNVPVLACGTVCAEISRMVWLAWRVRWGLRIASTTAHAQHIKLCGHHTSCDCVTAQGEKYRAQHSWGTDGCWVMGVVTLAGTRRSLSYGTHGGEGGMFVTPRLHILQGSTRQLCRLCCLCCCCCCRGVSCSDLCKSSDTLPGSRPGHALSPADNISAGLSTGSGVPHVTIN